MTLPTVSARIKGQIAELHALFDGSDSAEFSFDDVIYEQDRSLCALSDAAGALEGMSDCRFAHEPEATLRRIATMADQAHRDAMAVALAFLTSPAKQKDAA